MIPAGLPRIHFGDPLRLYVDQESLRFQLDTIYAYWNYTAGASWLSLLDSLLITLKNNGRPLMSHDGRTSYEVMKSLVEK